MKENLDLCGIKHLLFLCLPKAYIFDVHVGRRGLNGIPEVSF